MDKKYFLELAGHTLRDAAIATATIIGAVTAIRQPNLLVIGYTLGGAYLTKVSVGVTRGYVELHRLRKENEELEEELACARKEHQEIREKTFSISAQSGLESSIEGIYNHNTHNPCGLRVNETDTHVIS